jgi:hypothetical protein
LAIPEIHLGCEMPTNFTGKRGFKSLNEMENFVEPGGIIIHGRRVLGPSGRGEMSKPLVEVDTNLFFP